MAKWVRTGKLAMLLLVACVFNMVEVTVSQTQTNGTSDGQSSGGTVPTTKVDALETSMTGLYDLTNGFLYLIQPNRIYNTFGFLSSGSDLTPDNVLSQLTNDPNKIVEYLVGYVVCVAIGVVFIIAMMLTGAFFCCCRTCCGKCGGGKTRTNDSRFAKCKRVTFVITLLMISTMMLAASICAFVSNEILHQKLQNNNGAGPIGKVNNSIVSIVDYLHAAADDVQVKTVDTFSATAQTILSEVSDAARATVQDVSDSVNVSSVLKKADELALQVNQSLLALKDVSDSAALLSKHGQDLQAGLKIVRDILTATCASGPTVCVGIEPTQLSAEADFSNLQDISDVLKNVQNITDIADLVNTAKYEVTKVIDDVHQSIEANINNTRVELNKIESRISKELDSFIKPIKDIKLPAEYTSGMKDAENYLKQYSDYWWGACIGVTGIIMLIVVLVYLGLLFGLCGERAGEGAKCCNKGAGGNMLMAGVGFSFLFAWLIMLVTIILFIIGGPLRTELCRYLDRNNPQELKFADSLYDISSLLPNTVTLPDLSISDILSECKNNSGIYRAFHLNQVYNVADYLNVDTVQGAIDAIKGTNIQVQNITILSPSLESQIRNFANAGIGGINFLQFTNQTRKNLTTVDLLQYAAILNESSGVATDADVKLNLSRASSMLTELHNNQIVPMQQEVKTLEAGLNDLDDKTNLGPITNDLITSIKKAQDKFNIGGQAMIDAGIKYIAGNVSASVNKSFGNILDQVDSIGKCRPVYDAVYNMADAICLDVLDPLNTYWFSLGWALFFFIPCIIFSVKLAGLYRKSGKYVKDFDEGNMDLYAGNGVSDNIPLTRVDDQPKRSSNGLPNTGYHSEEYHHVPNQQRPTNYYRNGEVRHPPYGHHDYHGYNDGYNAEANLNGNPYPRYY